VKVGPSADSSQTCETRKRSCEYCIMPGLVLAGSAWRKVQSEIGAVEAGQQAHLESYLIRGNWSRDELRRAEFEACDRL